MDSVCCLFSGAVTGKEKEWEGERRAEEEAKGEERRGILQTRWGRGTGLLVLVMGEENL